MADQITFGFRAPDFPTDGATFKQFRDQIYRNLDAAQGGMGSAWIADHFFPWMMSVNQATATPEAWTMIAYLSGRYPSMTFGSIVLSQAYRNPALLAKMGASLQELTDGHFVLGLGAGWKENEYRAYGYDFPAVGTRISQLEEAVQIIRAMWSDDAPSFQGKYYQIDKAYCQPRPDPQPPLMIGGGGRKRTLRIAAQYADWWNFPGGTRENYQDLLNVLKEHCLAVGRNYADIRKTWCNDCVAVAPTHAAALAQAQASRFYSPETSIVGSPDEVAAQVRGFVDMGVSHFIFRFADFPSTAAVELFIKEVVPQFAA
jgi:alkanesulfonate monooxygenase SsuD/methylene tetrahydromethanopterin reductase-like flavin-dependent oxidoreductase (luciferase family)